MLISSWIFVTTFITIVKFNIVLKDLNLEMININAEIIIQRMIKIERLTIKIFKDNTYNIDHFSCNIFHRQAILSRYISRQTKNIKYIRMLWFVVNGFWMHKTFAGL